MEYLIGVIIALAGGVFVLWRKLQGEKVARSIAETVGKDEILKENQESIDKLIKNLDDGIEQMNKKREETKKSHKDLSLADRAKRWGK